MLNFRHFGSEIKKELKLGWLSKVRNKLEQVKNTLNEVIFGQKHIAIWSWNKIKLGGNYRTSAQNFWSNNFWVGIDS